MAYMRAGVLAVVLIIAACAGPSGPRAQSSSQPSGTPTVGTSTPSSIPTPSQNGTAGSPLTWAAPLRVDHQPPFAGNNLEGVSCPTSGLCVAVDELGNVVTSSNPQGGAAAWTVTHVDFTKDAQSQATNLSAVSCPSGDLCVAVDFSGDVVTSTNPTGGASASHVGTRDRTAPLGGRDW